MDNGHTENENLLNLEAKKSQEIDSNIGGSPNSQEIGKNAITNFNDYAEENGDREAPGENQEGLGEIINLDPNIINSKPNTETGVLDQNLVAKNSLKNSTGNPQDEIISKATIKEAEKIANNFQNPSDFTNEILKIRENNYKRFLEENGKAA